jgi:four helix bundle protein
MLIQLKQKSLDVYNALRELTKEIYQISLLLPSEEKFNMVQQIRRASLSVKLNLSEGCSRRSAAERKRYFERSRGSEIDAALETAMDLNYLNSSDVEKTSKLINKCFAMLSKMIS